MLGEGTKSEKLQKLQSVSFFFFLEITHGSGGSENYDRSEEIPDKNVAKLFLYFKRPQKMLHALSNKRLRFDPK